jgi:hypothetical protein
VTPRSQRIDCCDGVVALELLKPGSANHGDVYRSWRPGEREVYSESLRKGAFYHGIGSGGLPLWKIGHENSDELWQVMRDISGPGRRGESDVRILKERGSTCWHLWAT